ncbi:helix-turn-helix transcriptional regulator [Microgenomates group bacterium]|nr:helix-turn-helix transcriptional regulator [Microgenomates group bacterium]
MKVHLRRIRQINNLTQEELAKSLGVSRQTINAIETGRYQPSLILAMEIARFFKMSVEEMFEVGR